ncbi:MAG: glucosaminidase domain-containing protein [Candidatus Scatovivens sp.]
MKQEYYNKNGKTLPEIFKELKEKQKTNFYDQNEKKYENYIKSRQVINYKYNAIGVIIGLLIVLLFAMTIKSNAIFAKTKEEKVAIGEFEENTEPIDLMQIVSLNISDVETKKIVTETKEIEFETQYIQDNQLAKDEQVLIQEGILGSKEVTYIRSYKSVELIGEEVICENIISEPTVKVIKIGTSEFLANNKVKIGDTMYTINEAPIYKEINVESTQIGVIHQYIDITLMEVSAEWCKIRVDGIEGFVKPNLITSENVTPGIAEKSRINRIMLGVNFDMPLNVKSGLTKEDFKKVLSNNTKDTKKIFENNAEFFYEIEQTYNINGVFLASIGIHESNWGTSTIATNKKNLFGYGAYDETPYESSVTFESYKSGIENVAKALVKYYINPNGTSIYNGETAVGSFYNGSTLTGVNVRYASDSLWAEKVFKIMKTLYEKL